MKQDISGVRTAQDLERKYNFSSIKKAVELNEETITKVNNELDNFIIATTENLEELQEQVDGKVTTYYYSGVPSLSNLPASEWSVLEYAEHLGDLYYDKDTGYAYIFQLNSSVYSWQRLKDSQITEAMALANAAKDTADHKRQVFLSQPTTPYDNGDLWINNQEIYVCQVSRASGSFVSNDFIIATKYTDDTVAYAVVDELGGTTTTVLHGQVVTQMANYTKFTDLSNPASSTTIAGQHISTGVIQSNNYVANVSGTKLDISNGAIDSKNFKVDSSGNMTCNNATIQGGELKLADNTQIVGNNGLLTTMVIPSNVKSRSFIGGSVLLPCGFSNDYLGYYKDFLEFNFEKPSDLIIKSAYIILEHVPVRYENEGSLITTGYSRKMKLYKSTSRLSSVFKMDVGTYFIGYNSTFSEISGAFGANGFTGSSSAGSNIKSIDITNDIVDGFNLLKIETTETTPSSYNDMLAKSGACVATLYINGWTKFS